jgi:type IV pilus assembly protein PilV
MKQNLRHQRHFRRHPRGVRGFALLEALIGILIFSFGVLGLVGLQSAMTKAQTSSKFRADALYLASEVVGEMWVDVPNLGNYAAANCAGHSRCNAWNGKVGRLLPNGAGAVEILGGGAVRVTITWSPPNEGTHRVITETDIQL